MKVAGKHLGVLTVQYDLNHFYVCLSPPPRWELSSLKSTLAQLCEQHASNLEEGGRRESTDPRPAAVSNKPIPQPLIWIPRDGGASKRRSDFKMELVRLSWESKTSTTKNISVYQYIFSHKISRKFTFQKILKGKFELVTISGQTCHFSLKKKLIQSKISGSFPVWRRLHGACRISPGFMGPQTKPRKSSKVFYLGRGMGIWGVYGGGGLLNRFADLLNCLFRIEHTSGGIRGGPSSAGYGANHESSNVHREGIQHARSETDSQEWETFRQKKRCADLTTYAYR